MTQPVASLHLGCFLFLGLRGRWPARIEGQVVQLEDRSQTGHAILLEELHGPAGASADPCSLPPSLSSLHSILLSINWLKLNFLAAYMLWGHSLPQVCAPHL